MIRSLQVKILQYLYDMFLVRLDRDAVASLLDDTSQDSSTLLEVRIFTDHLFLGLVLS